MSVAAIVALVLKFKVSLSGAETIVDAKTALITAACTTIAWLLATFLTPAESQEKLTAFYRRVHPSIYGWRPIAKLAPEMAEIRDLGSNTFNWIMGCLLVYCSLFGIGKIVFQQWLAGLVLLCVAVISGYLIFWDLSRRGWQAYSGVSKSGAAAKAQNFTSRA